MSVTPIDYDALRADLHARRAAIDALLAALDAVMAPSSPASPTTIAAPRKPARAPGETKALAGETKARPTQALSESAVRTALEAGHDTGKALQKATRIPAWKLRVVLKAMKDAGSITSSGQTNNLRYRLA